MAEGTKTFQGLGVPLLGEYEQVQQTAATDIVTITGAGSQSGDFFVCQSSTGTEVFVVDVNGAVTAASNLSLGGKINKMVLGTIALASLASNASATVALSGLTTNSVVALFARGATTAPLPMVWASDADKLGYGAPSVACAATTVNYWYFATA